MNPKIIAFSVGIVVSFTGGRLSAVPIAYDDFNYTTGNDLNGQSGGGSFGFSDSWSGDTSFDIGSGSLASPTGQPVGAANSVTSTAFAANRDIHRTLTAPLGASNTTAYFSFLLRPEGILHQGFADGWFGFVLQGGFPVYVDMGSFTNQYGVEVSGTSSLSSTAAVVGETTFIVLRIDFTAGVDPARIYINPLPGNEPNVADAAVLGNGIGVVTTVGLTGPGAYRFDTLKVGTTWADVAPVPEPSTIVLIAIGCLGLLTMARSSNPSALAK